MAHRFAILAHAEVANFTGCDENFTVMHKDTDQWIVRNWIFCLNKNQNLASMSPFMKIKLKKTLILLFLVGIGLLFGYVEQAMAKVDVSVDCASSDKGEQLSDEDEDLAFASCDIAVPEPYRS